MALLHLDSLAHTPTLLQNGNNLSVTPAYQWILNGNAIPGATASTYTATSTGGYEVQVTDANGCIGTSDTTNVIVGLRNPSALGASLFPNPASQSASVLLTLDAAAALQLRLIDAHGKVVMQSELQATAGQNRMDLNVAALSAGVYHLHLSNGAAQQVFKFVKQ
jgi:hypothetical protein